MKKEEKEYYLKIIYLQDQMIQGCQSKNFSKLVVAQKELEKIQKSPYEDTIKEKQIKRDELIKRFKNLLTEIESVVKELNSL